MIMGSSDLIYIMSGRQRGEFSIEGLVLKLLKGWEVGEAIMEDKSCPDLVNKRF